MGTDYSEKERTFVSGLAEDSGRSLDGWMVAITEAKLTNRNEIIDWLRYQGFTFANASWLERIHHNGGRLIYAEGQSATPSSSVADRPPDLAAVLHPKIPAHSAPPPVPLPLSLFPADVSALLTAAKGLKPLAELALKEIAIAVPNVSFSAQDPLIVAADSQPFLALLPGAKALRLYANFDSTNDSRVMRSEAVMKVANKSPPPYPSVLVLTDARLVDTTFRSLVTGAHGRAHN